jgi:hypothetical protein
MGQQTITDEGLHRLRLALDENARLRAVLRTIIEAHDRVPPAAWPSSQAIALGDLIQHVRRMPEMTDR